MISAVYVAWNEAALIGESIRSVSAYVDQIVVVDCAFSSNPAEGSVGSSDGQRAVVLEAAGRLPVTYVLPKVRLEEHEARNLALEQAAPGSWAVLLDADEILVSSHGWMKALIEGEFGEVAPAVALRVYTSAVLFNGNADEMDEATYRSAPIVWTYGYQPRIVQRRPGLHYQRDEIRAGVFTHGVLWQGSTILEGRLLSEPVILNRHVAQDFAGYQADYAWEAAQRDGAR